MPSRKRWSLFFTVSCSWVKIWWFYWIIVLLWTGKLLRFLVSFLIYFFYSSNLKFKYSGGWLCSQCFGFWRNYGRIFRSSNTLGRTNMRLCCGTLTFGDKCRRSKVGRETSVYSFAYSPFGWCRLYGWLIHSRESW